MKITKIEQQKKDKGRFSLFVDDKFYLGLDDKVIAELNLYQGKEVDQRLLQSLETKEDYYKCLNKSFLYLSMRPHAKKELRDKLLKNFEIGIIGQVFSRLEELSYLDDRKFGELWIAERRKTRGKNLVKLELTKKGLDKSLIEELLEEAFSSKEEEIAVAEKLIAKKKFENLTKEERYKKAGGYLARHGFDYSVIKRVLGD